MPIPGMERIRFNSVPSRIYINVTDDSDVAVYWGTWRFKGDGSSAVALRRMVSQRFENALGFGIRQKGGHAVIHVPHWFPVVVSVTLATAPWIIQWQWRFSLRTLLIAITLVAIGLGLIVWLV